MLLYTPLKADNSSDWCQTEQQISNQRVSLFVACFYKSRDVKLRHDFYWSFIYAKIFNLLNSYQVRQACTEENYDINLMLAIISMN